MMLFLILAFSLLFLFLSFKRIDIALGVIVFALPSYLIRFEIFGMPMTVLEAMILLVFFAWFIKNWRHVAERLKPSFDKAQRARYPFDAEIMLILLFSFASVGFAGFSASAFGIFKAYFFEPILLFIVIFNVFGFKKELNKILWPFAFSALAVSLFAVFQKFTGLFIFNELWAAEETRRVVSFFGYPNAVGLFLGPLVLLFIGWLFHIAINAKSEKIIFNFQFSIFKQFFNSKIFKIIFISLNIVLALLAIYFARSEGALIGIMAGVFVFGLFLDRKLFFATIIITVIFLGGIFSITPARDYAINKITLNDFSGQVRKLQWAETWKMLEDGRVMAGAGLANYQTVIKPYHQEGFFFNSENDPEFHKKTVFNEEYREAHWQPLEIYLYPHNIFLNFWSEIGFFGMVVFIWVIIKFFIIGIKNINLKHENKFLIIGLIGAMTVIVIHGLVDVPYFKNDLAIMFWIFIAMMGILSTNKKI